MKYLQELLGTHHNPKANELLNESYDLYFKGKYFKYLRTNIRLFDSILHPVFETSLFRSIDKSRRFFIVGNFVSSPTCLGFWIVNPPIVYAVAMGI